MHKYKQKIPIGIDEPKTKFYPPTCTKHPIPQQGQPPIFTPSDPLEHRQFLQL